MGIPDDSLFAAQYVPQILEVPSVWESPQQAEPKLGLVDTPVCEMHPDLADVEHTESVDRVSGHGTELAGIMVAERDNNRGIAGLCRASLTVAPLSTDGPTSEALATAVTTLCDEGVDVICVPYRGPLDSDLAAAIDNAIAAEALVVTAAGNGATTFTHHTGYHDGVLCVGALTQSLSPAPFSKFGGVDVFAPGSDIIAPTTGSPKYDYVSGTSHACAVAAGIAALVQSRTGLVGQELKSHIEATAAELPVSRQLRQGYRPEPLRVVSPNNSRQRE